jgi:hypothetical protein
MKKTTLILVIFFLTISSLSSAVASNDMTNRLKGRLLLQVEDRGRIWYVSPDHEKRYEVTFVNALNLFETLSLGITNSDLYKIPMNPNSVSSDVDTDGDGFSDKSEVDTGHNPEIASDPNNRGNDKVSHDMNLVSRLKGRLLLQVENKGRIWYVDMDGQRHEVTWKNLMDLFKRLSLGITNSDLDNIDSDEEVEKKQKVNGSIDPWFDEDDDNDGLTNGDEVNIYKTNPFLEDSDADSSFDKQEIDAGEDPMVNSIYGNRVDLVDEGPWFQFHNISVTELPGWELTKFNDNWWHYSDPKTRDLIALRKNDDKFTTDFIAADDKLKFFQDLYPENENLELEIAHNVKGVLFYKMSYDANSIKTGIPYYLLTQDNELYNFSAQADIDGDPNQGEGIDFDLVYYQRQFFNSIKVVDTK